MLPTSPIVLSLLHYDNAKEHYKEEASPGYPLICVSPCERRHPEYTRAKHICKKEKINDRHQFTYGWEIAVPEEGDGGLSPFTKLSLSTVFGNTSSRVLDSMFFSSHFRIRCSMTPKTKRGQREFKSSPITISSSNSICKQTGSSLHGQNFRAKLSYMNESDADHPNSIHITMEIPHSDGMVPLISTLPLHNVQYLLTDKLYRAQYLCSNLLSTSALLNMEKSTIHYRSRPYQWDYNLREVNIIYISYKLKYI